MLPTHSSAQVVGRSMEPVLFEGDLLEMAPTSAHAAREGAIYCFELPWLQRPAAHRLVKKDGDSWSFRGDRQPFCEVIAPPEFVWEVRRVLERRITPEAGDVLFSLLRLLTRENLSFPRNATAAWPWEEILTLGQRHRLNAAIAYVLKRSELWREVPPPVKEKFESAWQEALLLASLVDETLPRLHALLPPGARFLKGVPLRNLYPAPELRVMTDIDVWVPKETWKETAEKLHRSGVFEWPEKARRQAEFWPHTILVCRATGVHVDLHSTLFQAHRFSWDGYRGERFTPEEEFTFLTAHLFMHFGRHGLTLLDLHLLLQKKPDLLRARQLAKERKTLLSFHLACRLLTRWFNDFLPDFSGLLTAEQALRLELAHKLYSDSLETNLFGRRKHFLQFLLADDVRDFWRLWRDPARRRVHSGETEQDH